MRSLGRDDGHTRETDKTRKRARSQIKSFSTGIVRCSSLPASHISRACAYALTKSGTLAERALELMRHEGETESEELAAE